MNTLSKKNAAWLAVGIVVVASIAAWMLLPGEDLSERVRTIAVDRDAFRGMRATGTRGATAEGERSLLPSVTAVERWEQSGNVISGPDNFAPGIVALKEGGYRMYWNDYPSGGITSATSEDGITFVPDEGLRISDTGEGNGCFASHPWLVALSEGYRMYHNSRCEKDVLDDVDILSAFSPDGITFEPEGIVVGVGKATGLTFAGHGRILPLADGTYRLYFSANTLDMEEGEPSAILGATSADGIEWTLDDALTLEMGHDPAIVWAGGKAHMYASFLAKNTLHLVSEDGYEFTPVAWMEFYDENGTRFEEFGDVEALARDGGSVSVYGGGKLVGSRNGEPGLVMMRESE